MILVSSNAERKTAVAWRGDMIETEFTIKPIGVIRSELVSREEAPNQGSEGSPDAWLEVYSSFAEGLEGIGVGDDIILITWFHKAHRDILKLHPRRDKSRPLTGAFSTRSPDRPNPLGLHRVTVREISGNRLRVGPLEAIDGTPVIDIKPVLPRSADS
jgi:tRNA-Thr(GGU) m(6)t(6)A37 methyltransferase TsaA